VSQAQAREQKRMYRLRDAVAPYRKNRTAEVAAFRPAVARHRSLAEMAASVFGFNPSKLDQYPVRWWIVLGVSFIAARVAAGFIVDVVGPLGLISMPTIWVMMCRIFFGWVAERRRALLLQQFPDALAMIVRSVRVGIPVLGAINVVAREAQAPTSLEFIRFGNEVSVGVPVAEAVTSMAERNDLAEYRFFATAIGLQALTGGGLSETLENLADVIRKRLALKERGHALSSEARTSSIILGGLPVVMGLGLWALNPGYMSVLFATSMGRTILGVAALSLACGAFAMRLIIKKSLS
jgi:tight adherence protein B